MLWKWCDVRIVNFFLFVTMILNKKDTKKISAPTERGGAAMADVRLIDAEWLKRVIRQHIKEHPGYPIYEKVMVLVCEALDDSPTVDAVPVVHGRWIETLVPDGYVQKASRMRKQCSVCGWTNACRYKYCPNCGAKMDLEVKNYG
jgi:hypothetical protein